MKIFRGFLFFCCAISAHAQIRVTTDVYTPEQLVRDILVNNNCAETSNYSSSTGLAQGVNGIGYFNANGSTFQYQEGIVLSTGNAVDSEGPNDEQFNTRPTAWTGDVDLSGITLIPILFNASYIQFDFVPRTNKISFNFLFASEEYSVENNDNYQCIFSDVFAFILTGPDGVSTNLALVPDTDELVSATTIRPGIPGSCEPANEDYFFGVNGADSPISQYGQTVSLTASSTVVPLETYTIKLVIADNSDAELDSAVYLEAGSFSTDVSLGDDRTVSGGNPLCIGEMVSLNAFSEGAQDYIWYRNQIELPALRNQSSIEVSETGIYSVAVVFTANCISNGEIALEFVRPPTIAEEPLDITACDIYNDGVQVFDFTENTERILGLQDPNVYMVTYYGTREDAENFEDQISAGPLYFGAQPNETIFARVSAMGGCYEITSFEINILRVDFRTDLEESYALCLDEFGNAMAPFPILDTGLSQNDYSFQWYSEAILDENLIVGATQASFTATEEGTFIVLVSLLEFGCTVPISTIVNASIPPEAVSIVIVSELFTTSTIVEIQVAGSGEYQYSIDEGELQDSNRFSGLGPGQHTATVVDRLGCGAIQEDFFIIDYPKFFTPNADGSNDTWAIFGLDEIEAPEVTIYDRHGKFVYQMTGQDWNGEHNGRPLPSSDYWFRISYLLNGDKKEFKGHFTLKR